MRLDVIAVGRPGPLLADAIAEYEQRAARYWPLSVIEVRSERATKGRTEAAVREAEGKRLLERVPPESRVIALTREGGDAWASLRLARHLEEMASGGVPGMAFLIGGALGLAESVLRLADRRMRLSTFTLPHDLARLVLAEQLYRAGTIVRGQPYHKGARE
jgi:23S rRNA (pseudouridine1915-N3)-methyltransferase